MVDSVRALWQMDTGHMRRVAERIGTGATYVEDWWDLKSLLHAIAECRVFVGVKLHAVVFASALGVPSLSIEYQPKCRDFQQSIGREDFTVRTDQLKIADALEMIHDLDARREEHSLSIIASVAERRSSLARAATRLQELVC